MSAARIAKGATAHGSAQATAQVLVWLLGIAGLEVPPPIAAAIGVLIGDVAYRLKWNRLLKRTKDEDDGQSDFDF